VTNDLPCLTLTKRAELDERPAGLDDRSLALERTLSMLCSFMSVEDFLVFLNSEPFVALTRHEHPWMVLELGLYLDHTKTLALVPQAGHLTIADEHQTGVLPDHVWTGEANESLADLLETWMVAVGPGTQ